MSRLGLTLALAVGGALFAPGPSTVLRAQIPLKYQYQHRQDPNRFEGLRVGHQVAGERLEPVSAIAHAGLRSSQNPDRISLGFAANGPVDVSITVRDLEKNYWMEPTDASGNKIFRAKSGFNSFTWDATDINYIHRTAQDLYAWVERLGPGGTYVLPAIVFDPSSRLPSELRVTEYEFVFHPNAEADLAYQIQSKAGKKLKSGDLVDLRKDGVAVVRWDPAGQPNGMYQLVGTATFHFKNGKPDRHQGIQIDFCHVASILPAN
jgi:hypothetical protein